jgi:hypothetical protein
MVAALLQCGADPRRLLGEEISSVDPVNAECVYLLLQLRELLALTSHRTWGFWLSRRLRELLSQHHRGAAPVRRRSSNKKRKRDDEITLLTPLVEE